MLIWNKSEKVFEKWMNICLHYKKMGDDLNIKEKDEQEKLKKEAEIRNEKYEIKLQYPGNALHNFGKLLASAAIGQTLMANYGFMLNIHDNVLYKSKNGNKRGEIKTKLFLCDNKENDMIQDTITGGRTLLRTHNFESKDKNLMILKII